MCFLWSISVSTLVLVLSTDADVVQLDLTGTWTVSNAARGISVSGQVPGSMYTALFYNNVTEDPLYRDNDVKLAWVGRESWTYSRFFEVDDTMAKSKSILLVAEGMDTVSTVFINGQRVAATNNMFIKYTWDVTPFLKPGNNSIDLRFQSAVDYAGKQAASYPYDIPPDCPPAVQNGECHVNFVRKEPCSFSWNWGPRSPPRAYEPSNNQSWLLKTRAFFNVSGDGSASGELNITLDTTGISQIHTVALSADRDWVEFVDVVIPQTANIKRWWPRGYGTQALYDVIFTFTSDDGDVTSQTKRIGFRTVKLIQDPVSADPKQGLTFYFEVNGLPVFLKGANWVPADSFQERISRESLQTTLTHAVEANMNCFRVWGGGVYESEDFYDLADEMGILIYQDFMFSDASYPTNPEFMDNVHWEVTYQVRRLMHRPSLLVWSGSNENEQELRRAWHLDNFTRYYEDYIKLYVDTVWSTVRSENPSRDFLTSSPSNGKEEAQEGYLAKNPASELFGDVRELVDPGDIPHPRMASEFGVISWCNYHTLLGAFDMSDMAFNSSQAIGRQHYGYGNAAMINETTYHLDLPPSTTAEPQRFKDFIYITQINQAMSHKTETEHYRRHQGQVGEDGRGLTMGAIYWMLKDIWQAPSRASIDYSGRWKMLHYYAARFFSPMLVSPFIEKDELNVFVVVDEIPVTAVRDPVTHCLRFEPQRGSKITLKDTDNKDLDLDLISKAESVISGVLTVQLYSWHSFNPLRQWNVSYQLNSTAQSVFRQNVSSMLREAGCTSNANCFIYTYLNEPTDGVNNWLYLAELKHSNISQANVTIASVQQRSPVEFTIVVSSTAIAPFVWLEAGSIMGRFSDNGFLLVKASTAVTFVAWQHVPLDTLTQQLSVRSLMDVYEK